MVVDQSSTLIRSHIEARFPGDHPRRIVVREHLISACERFVASGLADPKFASELASGSDQKFWACVSEALIAALLFDKQFGTRARRGTGPDFLVLNGSRRIWVEVVCPEPVNLPADWLDPPSGTAIEYPHERILLRWMSAIKAKAEALIGSFDGDRPGYIDSGVVSGDDAYVIAVNGCLLRGGRFPGLMGISQFPYATEAVFPIGPYQLQIDRETQEVVDRGHQHRPYVLNKNGARVPAYTFLDPRFDRISAIWAVDLDGGSAIGNNEPMLVVHNPNARNPIPHGFLPAHDEYAAAAEGDEFVLRKAARSEMSKDLI